VQARAQWSTDHLRREPTDISPEEDARLADAEKAFRNLGAEMRAFANGDRIAYQIVRRLLRYDADQIAGALIAYSNNISTYGEHRFNAHRQLESILHIRAESASR
jgi:hypothetical protein